MIELAVIVASEIAAVLSAQALHLAQLATSELSDKDVEMPVKRGGNESDPFAVGGETWLNVDRALLGELLRALGLQVERPEFNRIFRIGGVNNPASVGRAIGLIVVAGAGRQLLGDCCVDVLPPKPPRP